MLGQRGVILVPPGAILGPTWALLRPSWTPSRQVVGRPPGALPPESGENARDILHFGHLAVMLPHLVAHLAHPQPSYSHLTSS